MQIPNLDMDALRSFVAGVELGSFARASDRLGRSTSAVSAQLKKLEEQAGVALVRKAGRGLALTDAGETLLSYARRLLDLNDEALTALRGVELEGWVRLGLQEDFGEAILPHVLGRFARAHPKVRIESRIARNSELVDKTLSGHLDLALAWDGGEWAGHAERLAEVPLCWLAAQDGVASWRAGGAEPLPLAALEAPCLLRTLAASHLDRQGMAWRLAFVSPSLSGLWAAAAAGLGIVLRTQIGRPSGVHVLDPATHGLPQLPTLGLMLYRPEREPSPAVRHLEAILRQAVGEAVAQGGVSVPVPARALTR
ncbi:LysR substrate-binding domain-containing protein [Azorhizobium caulinodans]|uniref:LysR substrate-binding domain-containing protein n=1 Tax=Azorhizobium caulinodans TaxID=7 RepID=UPI002FBEFF01